MGSNLPQRGDCAVSVDSAVSLVGGPASAFLSGADGCVDFAGEVAIVVISQAVLAGEFGRRAGLCIPSRKCRTSLVTLIQGPVVFRSDEVVVSAVSVDATQR